MKKTLFAMFLLFAMFAYCPQNAMAEITLSQTSQLGELKRYRNVAKLYAPNFVLIGEASTFKVYTEPNTEVTFKIDYGYLEEIHSETKISNEQGIATFEVTVPVNEELVGKSAEVEASVLDKETNTKTKAVLQNESGTAHSYNRIYIADNKSADGVMFTPWKVLNQFIMNTDYDERSGYNPMTDQIYDDTTPVYVRNMRDAQENVREVPRNINNSN